MFSLKQPYEKEPWEMTLAEFEREKRLRRDARALAAAGHVDAAITSRASAPALEGVAHGAAVQAAVDQGLPVTADVLVSYPVTRLLAQMRRIRPEVVGFADTEAEVNAY